MKLLSTIAILVFAAVVAVPGVVSAEKSLRGISIQTNTDDLDSEDLFSESEDYKDEDMKEFDSEDLASEDFANDNEDEEDADTQDIDFLQNQNRSQCVRSGRGFRYFRRYFHTRSRCCTHEFDVCKDNKPFHNKNCARIKQKCFDFRGSLEDEDMKEFDSDSESQDVASEEDFANDNEDEEDTEDIDFYYNGRRNPNNGYRRNNNGYNNGYDDGYGYGYGNGYGYGYGNGSNKYVNDCERQFRNCKDDKSFGYGGTNCARMKQQCYGRRPYGAEVA